ncbi:hypothetical protein GCU67_08145 [Modestobacter muralis]|uniref:Uncharacterized protein n=1 Tax=Modestobacter muralis TaxID=1608614 RepID=A0A6P0ET85_9ACTN|nr:hypothetical protein [Modestobacter muralis]NEK94145.1 hypothetical protein [Modestobacter muralis]NEN50912.1 hypothetical protein [Modestobacter muralis]
MTSSIIDQASRDHEVRRLHSAVAVAARYRGPEAAHAARQALRHALLTYDVQDALDAGLLSEEQRRDLAARLTGGQR